MDLDLAAWRRVAEHCLRNDEMSSEVLGNAGGVGCSAPCGRACQVTKSSAFDMPGWAPDGV